MNPLKNFIRYSRIVKDESTYKTNFIFVYLSILCILFVVEQRDQAPAVFYALKYM